MSNIQIHTTSMKTATRSPLNNRGYEHSEHPRTEPTSDIPTLTGSPIINNIYLTINVATPQAATQIRTTLEQTLLKGPFGNA